MKTKTMIGIALACLLAGTITFAAESDNGTKNETETQQQQPEDT